MLTTMLPLALVLPTPAVAEPERLCPAAVTAIDVSVAKTMAQGSPGMMVAIARRGRPVLVKGYGLADLEQGTPVRDATVFRLASVTKQFTAAAILLNEDAGRLSLDDPLSKYVPELAQASKVTLYQLLVHTSGIPDYADTPAILKSKSVARTGEEMLAVIGALQPALAFEPGTRWAYSNSNYALLGLVLERVEKRPLAAIFRDRLFTPAGLTETAFDVEADIVPERAQGYRRAAKENPGFRNAEWISHTIPGAAGGLRTTAGDLLRWADALHHGRVLKPVLLERLTTPGRLSDGRTTKLGMPAEWQKGLNADYGMGLFITPTPSGPRIWHGGDIDGFSTWLAHYPERDVTIALMINSQSADLNTDAIEAAALAGLAGGC